MGGGNSSMVVERVPDEMSDAAFVEREAFKMKPFFGVR